MTTLDPSADVSPTNSSLERLRAIQPILRCPVDESPLTLLSRSEFLGRLANDERQRIPGDLTGAFISARGLAYPVFGRIISFLDRDAVQLGAVEIRASNTAADGVKKSVQTWYDQFGWKKNEDGVYHDTALFSQNEASGHDLYEMSSHLRLLERLTGGEFLLDAASGAIARPESLSYSWRYRFRICVDMSITALREAETKIGDRGFYCLADICRLPFKPDAMEGIVSGYTIQHIPESEQARAVQELYRVLKPGAHLCVMTDVEPRPLHRAVVLGYRAVRKLAKLTGLAAPFSAPSPAVTDATPPHSLYFLPREVEWWRQRGTDMSARSSVECLRSLTKGEFESIWGRSTRAARFVGIVETIFRRPLADASPYCLVDYQKPAVHT